MDFELVKNKFKSSNIHIGQYSLSLAQSELDLRNARKLRHLVFGADLPSQLPVDSFDENAIHLVVLFEGDCQIVGNYRLRSSEQTNVFYSACEFDISDFLLKTNNQLELSRACIHPEHRNGVVLDLI